MPRQARVSASVDLDSVFSALSDPTRRSIVEHLTHGGATVTELSKPFEISLPAISKHLRILEDVGLLTREKKGRVHTLRLSPRPLISTLDWMERYRPLWETQLDSLVSYLEREKKENSR